MSRLILKATLFLVLVAGGGLAGALILADPGQVSIQWGGWRVDAHAATLLIAAVALLLLIWLVWGLWTFVLGLPGALGGFARRRRQRRGLEALGRALTAYVAEDAKTALANARRAERLLANPQLTRALMAKTLDLSGSRGEAKRYFAALAEDPDTAVAGLRGLLGDATRSGDRQEALALASRAARLDSRNPALLRSLLDLQVAETKWADARSTLTAMVNARAISRTKARAQEAVLFAAEAIEAELAGGLRQAKNRALSAVELAPELAPAAALAARTLAQDGDQRRAQRILQAAWQRDPQSELAAAWMRLAPNTDAEIRRKWLIRLLDSNADHPESRILRAELAISGRDWQAARQAIGDLAESDPSARVCAVMAAIEKGGEGDDDTARAWLARALTAPRGRSWRCGDCGASRERWEAACGACSALGSVAMRDDPRSPGAHREETILPLLAEPDSDESEPVRVQTSAETSPDPSPPQTPEPEPVRGEPTRGARTIETQAEVIRPDA